MSWVRDVLVDPRMRRLAAIQLIDAVGSGVFLAGSSVLYVKIFGFSAGQVATGLSLAGFAGLIATSVMGQVADRLGHKHVLLVLTALQCISYLLFFLVDAFWQFTLLVAAISFLDFGKASAFNAVIAEATSTGDSVVRNKAALRSVFNAGFFGGSSLAAAAVGLRSGHLLAIFVGTNAFSYLACVLLVRVLPPPRNAPRALGSRRFTALRDLRFLYVVALTTLLGLHGSIMTVAMPLWVLGHTSIDPAAIGALFALNTVLSVTLQVYAARGTEQVRGSARAARQSSWLVATGCVGIAVTAGLGQLGGTIALAVAVLVLTGGELRQAASRWGMSFALAPESARAEYLGAFNICVAAGSIVGPALTVFLTTHLGWVGWIVLASIVLLAGVAVGPAAMINATRGVDSGLLAPSVVGHHA
ncbi:MFS transporter [Kineosporia sp. NBRC 101731]|uniref:MFS transporter n=1 Tax=Kineosporia sp. NBRC 101731 TaxID=3032199 RepID=UPI0024A0F1FD|nr:MFS transporter [Kineosporia sp. NBRC 101731]GLY33865.1 MFS transporter [Kineosporia sp. NBRC 101731]